MIEAADSSLCAQIVNISLLIDCDSVHLSYRIGQLYKIELLIEHVEVALVEQIDPAFEYFDPINVRSKNSFIDQSPFSLSAII